MLHPELEEQARDRLRSCEPGSHLSIPGIRLFAAADVVSDSHANRARAASRHAGHITTFGNLISEMKPVDLLEMPEWPYVFSQRHLLTPQDFCREAERRGCRLDPRQLEAFHKAGVLVPLYQIGPAQWRIERVDGGGHSDLLSVREAGGLQDPRLAGYVPWSRFRGRTGPIRRYTRYFLYSWYQLLAVPDLLRLQARLRPRPTPLPGRRYNLRLRPGEGRELVNLDLIGLLTRLEPAFLPHIRLRLSGGLHPKGPEAWTDEFATYDHDFRAAPILREFDIDGDKIRELAEQLLIKAGFIDPIRKWLPLVRNMAPERWEELTGPALSAIDARVAAEMLLRFHSELVDEGAAEPLPELPEMASHPLRERIQRTPEDLDPVLMNFGLSRTRLCWLSLRARATCFLQLGPCNRSASDAPEASSSSHNPAVWTETSDSWQRSRQLQNWDVSSRVQLWPAGPSRVS